MGARRSERTRWTLLALTLLVADGCAGSKHAWNGRRIRTHPGPAAMVEGILHRQGLLFGTDGSVPALYAYLDEHHQRVAPSEVRPGDVVFFAFDADDRCGTHVGLVESVDPDGRVAFRESRDGSVRRSYLDPANPLVRRDAEGRILNTFLRPKRLDDPPAARYFAGEMLCAAIRVASD